MKKCFPALPYLLAFLILVNIVFGVRVLKSYKDTACDESRERRLKLAKLSYESGCLIKAIDVCSRYPTDETRSTCYDSAVKGCPEMAETYRNWLETGK